jgi:CheY-like chemotaxis protein
MDSKKPFNIMLIDDDIATNYYHGIIIRDSGIDAKVETFTYVRNALDALTANWETSKKLPDIVFLDINMPGMTGWDFLDEFDKLPNELKSEISIFILTTSENPADHEKGVNNPYIKKFMIKPLTEETLKIAIETSLVPHQ